MRSRSAAVIAVGAIIAAAGAAAVRGTRTTTRPAAPPRAIVASLRAEPRSFNRLVARDQTSLVLTYLLHSGLVRVNRATDRLEPELAESWELLPDRRTFRVHLRRNVAFSDGVPFTAEDVVFSFRAIYDPRTASVLADSLLVGGQPIRVQAEDAQTVLIRFPVPFGPGLRLLDGVPMLPRHKLEPALAAGSFREAWGTTAKPEELAGLGPFVIREYRPGQRLVLGRNPLYWRREGGEPLPRANELVLQIVADQDAESLALQAGAVDFTQSELRPSDIAGARKAADAGRLALSDLGVGVDGDLFWINLGPRLGTDRRSRWLQHPDFRRAIAHAIDREAFVNTVFLGAAVPGYGVVSPGNRGWYVETDAPRFDPAAARRLLASLQLVSRGNRLVDPNDRPVRFTILTQRGNTAQERGAAMIRDSLDWLGVTVDVVGLEPGALVQRLLAGDYDAAYFRLVTTDTDPALNADFWRSSGSAHIWNPEQRAPASSWESAIDALMNQVETSLDERARRSAFGEIQQIMARELPAVCFAFPRLSYATSTRLAGATPAPFRPPLLWNPAVIGVGRQQ